MSRKIQETFRSAFAEYVVANPVGEGGSGTVYEVADAESRRFALKAIDPGKSTSQKLKRFQNEIRFCRQTVHPNVVREGGICAPIDDPVSRDGTECNNNPRSGRSGTHEKKRCGAAEKPV
jgi:serine/threonine protein kinase